jgi:RNA polymerase sigma factor (sigma-70 family)
MAAGSAAAGAGPLAWGGLLPGRLAGGGPAPVRRGTGDAPPLRREVAPPLPDMHPITAAEAAGPPAYDEEGALLLAYGNGDPDAARALAALIAPRILGQAMRMLADRAEAEDVTQEVMLRLWRAAPAWRQGEARIATWAWRVTSNLCVDRLRRRRPHAALDEGTEPPDPAPSAPERLQAEARLRALSDALARLPERQAQAVSLRHLEGLSNPEIAAIMDIGVEAVESLTARGKRALAALLGARKGELGHDD